MGTDWVLLVIPSRPHTGRKGWTSPATNLINLVPRADLLLVGSCPIGLVAISAIVGYDGWPGWGAGDVPSSPASGGPVTGQPSHSPGLESGGALGSMEVADFFMRERFAEGLAQKFAGLLGESDLER